MSVHRGSQNPCVLFWGFSKTRRVRSYGYNLFYSTIQNSQTQETLDFQRATPYHKTMRNTHFENYEPKGRGFESLQPYQKRCCFDEKRHLFFYAADVILRPGVPCCLLAACGGRYAGRLTMRTKLLYHRKTWLARGKLLWTIQMVNSTKLIKNAFYIRKIPHFSINRSYHQRLGRNLS